MIFQAFSGEVADLRYLLMNKTAKILAGNPDQIAELIRCSPYSRRFTSLVLSFNEELEKDPEPGGDAKGILTLGLLLGCVNDTLRLLAPEGMLERLAYLVVIHRDKGRTEVHVLIVNVDLATSRQYSPYVHGRDAARLRNYQEVVNVRYGFTDPEDLNRQLQAMPNPRMGHLSLISKITKEVQSHFQSATQVTVDDVADYLERAGYRIQRKSREGKNQRLAVFSKEGNLVRLPGIWFRGDFDLAKFRAKRRKTISELRQELMRRTARHKELTAKSHRRKPNDFRMEHFPCIIKMPIKMQFFASFFSVDRWEDRKISILQESLLCGAERRAEWIQDLSTKLKFDISLAENSLQGSLPLASSSIAKTFPGKSADDLAKAGLPRVPESAALKNTMAVHEEANEVKLVEESQWQIESWNGLQSPTKKPEKARQKKMKDHGHPEMPST